MEVSLGQNELSSPDNDVFFEKDRAETSSGDTLETTPEGNDDVVFRDQLATVGGEHKSDGHALRLLQRNNKGRTKLERHDSLLLEFNRKQDRAELDQIYREDIAAWLSRLFDLNTLSSDNLLESIESGELLCKLAGKVHENLDAWKYVSKMNPSMVNTLVPPVFKANVTAGSFHARSNLHNFLTWAKHLHVPCLFESADLIERKNTTHITSCLMDVARGAPYLAALPSLVEFEQEMQEQERQDDGAGEDSGSADADEAMDAMVQEVAASVGLEKRESISESTTEDSGEVETAPVVPVVPAGKNQYWIKGQKMHVRCFNSHIVVRVGGGWDTLTHYLSTLGMNTSKENLSAVEEQVTKNIRSEKSGKKVKSPSKKAPFSGLTKSKSSHGADFNTIDLNINVSTEASVGAQAHKRSSKAKTRSKSESATLDTAPVSRIEVASDSNASTASVTSQKATRLRTPTSRLASARSSEECRSKLSTPRSSATSSTVGHAKPTGIAKAKTAVTKANASVMTADGTPTSRSTLQSPHRSLLPRPSPSLQSPRSSSTALNSRQGTPRGSPTVLLESASRHGSALSVTSDRDYESQDARDTVASNAVSDAGRDAIHMSADDGTDRLERTYALVDGGERPSNTQVFVGDTDPADQGPSAMHSPPRPHVTGALNMSRLTRSDSSEDILSEVILVASALSAISDRGTETQLVLKLGFLLGLLQGDNGSDGMLELARCEDWNNVAMSAKRMQMSPTKKSRQYTVL